MANKLGVPAEAIAGIMAKENDWYLNGDTKYQVAADGYAYAFTFRPGVNHEYWSEESQWSRYLGPTKWEKGMAPSLIDAGRANFQIATAIRLLEWYKPYMEAFGDPLGLGEYVNDYNQLVRTLTNGEYACGGEGVRLTAALYSLMIKEALEFFESHADPAYWASLDPVTRDAILVTYCTLGRQAIEAEWKRKTASGEPYEPDPGPGPAGGWNHIYNACDIGRVMLDPNYGGCRLPKCTMLDPVSCEPRKMDCLPPPPGPLPPTQRRDPLVLDLNGDGIMTTSVNGRTYFDHDANGLAEQTGWVAGSDGLLVLDRNGDGIINDGKELFSDQTILRDGSKAANGFQALAELDGNHDGQIDANDEAFSQLRVWKDQDGDGFSLPSELYTLDELGVKSISLDSTITNDPDAQGNTRTRVGSFEKTDGTSGEIAEYSLQRNTTYTRPKELLPIPEDIAMLPNLQGRGNVYTLAPGQGAR
jgi:hypothetical protein